MHQTATEIDWDAIIVGGGPAGLSAALMLGRSRRRVLVIDAGTPRNRFAAHMHGVLGHEGSAPAELIAKGRQEAAEYGVRFADGAARRVEDITGALRITLDSGESHATRALIVATGVVDVLPDVPGLAEKWGTSVLHCPYCHGWEVADQRLGVLATSPMMVHQAQLVRQWSDRVTLFSAGMGTLDAADEARLRSRGVRIVTAAVTEVLCDAERATGVRTADGQTVELDAIFTLGALQPRDDFLAGLDLARAEFPLASMPVLTVDHAGRTSHDRIWATGNIVNPMANVPMSMGAGALTGSAVNGALVEEDFDEQAANQVANLVTRVAEDSDAPHVSAVEYWEARYSESDRIWSGRVNQVLADTASTLEPGTALDLGCGEGGDAVWLAQRGWDVTGVDLSHMAIERGREAAMAEGVAGRVHLEQGDLSEWTTDRAFDLVSCSFLHSWQVEFPREEILRRAAEFVAPGGHLLITSHAAAPPWAHHDREHNGGHDHVADHAFPTPESDLLTLELAPDRWRVATSELRDRTSTGPDRKTATLTDAVVLVQRLS